MTDENEYYQYEDCDCNSPPSPPTPDNTPPRPQQRRHFMEDIITLLGNKQFTTRNSTNTTTNTATNTTTNTAAPNTATNATTTDLTDIFKLITPIISATNNLTTNVTANASRAKGALTAKQRKNITHAFAIAECEQHTDKFLRVLSERDTPLDVITGRQILSIITVVLPEIQQQMATRLAKLLMLALE